MMSGIIFGDCIGTTMGVIKEVTRSLDYSLCDIVWLGAHCPQCRLRFFCRCPLPPLSDANWCLGQLGLKEC